MTLRVLVTVSRGYCQFDTMNTALASVFWEFGAPRDAVLVSGHCPDGDAQAEEIWRGHGLTVEPYPARWREHAPGCPPSHAGQEICRTAGYRRDAEMVALGATVCLPFIGFCINPKCKDRATPHASHGASGTARMARAAGIDTRPIADPLVRESIEDLYRPLAEPVDATLTLPGT